MAPSALVRLAVLPQAPHLVPDFRAQLGGRGVWVETKCLGQAIRRGGFSRALRREVTIDEEALSQQIHDQLWRRLEGLCGGAQRSRHAFLGEDAVREAMNQGKVDLLWVASDAGRRERREEYAERLGSRCLVFLERPELGALFHSKSVAIAAIQGHGLADAITSVTENLRGLRFATRNHTHASISVSQTIGDVRPQDEPE